MATKDRARYGNGRVSPLCRGVPPVRKIVAAMIVLGAMLCGPAPFAGDAAKPEKKAESFKFLETWVDKIPLSHPPYDSLQHPSRKNLWDVPEIKESMIRTLGKERFDTAITGWGEGHPSVTLIKTVNENICFSLGCSFKNDCFNVALVYISMKNGDVHVCWHDREDLWLSPKGDVRKLPEGHCRARYLREIPEIYLKQMTLKKD